jgi:uncharacterized membrane protein
MSPIYLHLLVNQLPVAITVLGVALLAWAVVRGDESRTRTSLAMFVFAAVLSVATFFTGKRAAGGLEGAVPAALIDQHHAMARLATLALLGLGAASLVALTASRGRKLPRRVALLLLVASLAPAVALVWTATRGGRIRHPELRPGVEAPAGTGRRVPAAHAEEVGVYEP